MYEMVKQYQRSVDDYITSYEMEPEIKTFYEAVKVASRHGI